MAKKKEEKPVDRGFLLTLDEFLGSIKKVEARMSFRSACLRREISGKKYRDEWENLYNGFKTSPVGEWKREHIKKTKERRK